MNTFQRLIFSPCTQAGFAMYLLLGTGLPPALAADAGADNAAETPEVIRNSNLNADTALLIMLGELQASQGDPGAAYSLLLDAARKTGDEALYKRAVDVALNSRNGTAALDGAKAWKKAYPLSRDANRYVLQILVALNQLADSLMPLRSYVQLAPESEQVLLINGMSQIYAQAKDTELAAAVVEQALVPFVDKPATAAASWTTIGRMRVAAKKLPEALETIDKALAKDPKAIEPGFLALELLSLGMTEAEPVLKRILTPDSPPTMRLTYARVLIDAHRLLDASDLLQALNKSHPALSEAWLVQGALWVELGKDNEAQQALLRYVELEKNKEDARLSQAYLMLSKIASNQKKTAEAESWLNKIDDPEALAQVQIQRANMLAARGDMAKARALLAELPHNTPQEKRIRLQAEVQLLREHKMYEQVYQVLLKASKVSSPAAPTRWSSSAAK
jgi:tetratricopeptide (TPR) repeat protein